jgi:hypothetical protein
VDNLYDAIQDASSPKAITKINTQVKDSEEITEARGEMYLDVHSLGGS